MCLPRRVVAVLDALMRIDDDQARLDTSSGQASIQVLTAVSTVNGVRDYEVSNVIRDMWAKGDGMRIDVPINAILECLGVEDLEHDTTVVTRVKYRGHSNAKKRYSSETFSARYEAKLSQVFRFPPYPSSEKIRRGFGVARILRANFVGDNGALLYGPEAKESSGLRRNYYADVHDDECLAKNIVTFFDASTRFQERKQIVVTTSKPDCKFICNQIN